MLQNVKSKQFYKKFAFILTNRFKLITNERWAEHLFIKVSYFLVYEDLLLCTGVWYLCLSTENTWLPVPSNSQILEVHRHEQCLICLLSLSSQVDRSLERLKMSCTLMRACLFSFCCFGCLFFTVSNFLIPRVWWFFPVLQPLGV